MSIKLKDIFRKQSVITRDSNLKLSDFNELDRDCLNDILQNRIDKKEYWYFYADKNNNEVIITTRINKYDVDRYKMENDKEYIWKRSLDF